MYYRIQDHIALRKWKYVDRAIYMKNVVHALPVKQEEFDALLMCDGMHDLDKSPAIETLLDKGYGILSLQPRSV